MDRDEVAVIAMFGYLVAGTNATFEGIAKLSFNMAEAMIKEKEKRDAKDNS